MTELENFNESHQNSQSLNASIECSLNARKNHCPESLHLQGLQGSLKGFATKYH